MIAIVHPTKIEGIILANASKSCMQRACAAALLHHGTTQIVNPGNSFDDLAAIEMIQKLGATIINHSEESLTIQSTGVAPISQQLNCGESGLGIRMFTPIAALSKSSLTINGSGSLLKRPMHFFDEVLPQLKVHISSAEGFLPITIQGPLTPTNITIDGSLSSQFLTGLLMAFGAAEADGVTITVNDLKSRPYIDLTLQVMEAFGTTIQNNNYESFSFVKTNKKGKKTNIQYQVEGDWSGAAFLLVAGAIAGNITVKGLNVFSTQADKAILQALSDAGAGLSVQEHQIEVRSLPLKAFHFDATDCPDLFPPLVALAAFCDGTTVIEGVHRLAHKESNRGITLQEEFAKLGVEIKLQDNLMLVVGLRNGLQVAPINSAKVSSHHDHRIAMATAIAALNAGAPVTIQDAEAINKSYPAFYSHLQQLGVGVITEI
ncbi:MAG: 3-phosphoshikimate 1-carboxyvinyltransferase [Sediminibacterium sp.]|uniref:3-phosphoshikimate 1-carboxyvinyltransferase n=1 Tax=Sediminibacterium sp. TaxID=1917865 RepID=UPI00272615FC|nr:3-phosphoshikimate 1-carboxyvinyltransferase [Sediminibacterium sp.]MDO8995380.1 3-phosphoshikimate 1-carboxyvinyltransferase [Sediminibacterium sp.]